MNHVTIWGRERLACCSAVRRSEEAGEVRGEDRAIARGCWVLQDLQGLR